MPAIQGVVDAMVWRESDQKDTHGHSLPPWKEVTVTNAFFSTRPLVGTDVTIVPLGVSIATTNLRIVKVTKQEKTCDGLPLLWETELEPIKLKEFYTAKPTVDRADDTPFDVIVVYPAVKVAQPLAKHSLTKAMLPRGVFINTVKAAVDLTNDGQPDIVITEYCCREPRKTPNDQCEYICSKTFKKVAGVWKLINTSSPC